ncbi:MAG TPA: hypothetical protein VIH35_09045 [Kiritimatiellia bacterium]|jgi:hypothetical protein
MTDPPVVLNAFFLISKPKVSRNRFQKTTPAETGFNIYFQFFRTGQQTGIFIGYSWCLNREAVPEIGRIMPLIRLKQATNGLEPHRGR